MNAGTPSDPSEAANPPVSSFDGPVAELIRSNLLGAPSRVGLLAALDHYEILEVVGRGGMGLVFRGRDSRNGMTVAIKVIRNDIAQIEPLASRFIKEAHHLQKLRHPNVVPVLDMSDNPKRPYFVMPFFERGSLAKHIATRKELDSGEVAEIAKNIAEALSFAHRKGIIHRDLKPANVLLTSKGAACLSDFGLALTMFNDSAVDIESIQVDGTAPYFSPAVAAGDAEDTRRDIYAFGAVLYEMLTGTQPYHGETTKEIRAKIVAGRPPEIRSVNPKADPNLAVIADGAMAREVRARYADMAEVIEDLDRINAGQEALGPRIGGGKLRLKSKQKALLATAIVGALVALVGAFLWKYHARGAKPQIDVAVLTPASTPQLVAVLSPTNSQRVPSTLSPSALPAVPSNPLLFHGVSGIALAPNGDIFLTERDNYTIMVVRKDGGLSQFAGLPGQPGTADGGAEARFSIIRGIATDRGGNLIVSDAYRIRKISANGVVSTIAGAAGQPGETDGISDDARFEGPAGVDVDQQGDIVVADMYAIRKIALSGAVSTIAGGNHHSGAKDGGGSDARFGDRPKQIAVGQGNLAYVADTQNCTIRRVDISTGAVTTIAGLRKRPGANDGPGSSARFKKPTGITVSQDGTIYVADEESDTIRKISADGIVSTLAGSPGAIGFLDGSGQDARFNRPTCLTFDGSSKLLVFDSGNNVVRTIGLDGTVATVTGR